MCTFLNDGDTTSSIDLFLVKTNQIIVDFRLTTINTVTAENQFNALA